MPSDNPISTSFLSISRKLVLPKLLTFNRSDSVILTNWPTVSIPIDSRQLFDLTVNSNASIGVPSFSANSSSTPSSTSSETNSETVSSPTSWHWQRIAAFTTVNTRANPVARWRRPWKWANSTVGVWRVTTSSSVRSPPPNGDATPLSPAVRSDDGSRSARR